MVFESQTLIVPSHEAVARTGFLVSGENLTQLTQSVWASSWTVYLHCPTVFQILIVLSILPEAICLLSAENEHDKTSFSWSTKVTVLFPLSKSHNLSVLSHEDERQYLLSCDRHKSWTKCECDLYTLLAFPHSKSSSVESFGVIFQAIIVLSNWN